MKLETLLKSRKERFCMDGNLPIWFNLTVYFLGIVFMFFGYIIRSGKQISLLGNIGKLKKEKDINTVCKLTSVYLLVLGAGIISIPMVGFFFNFYAVLATVGAAIIGSVIFWLTLSKIYFTPSAE